jgi:hypothetical protein
MDMRKPVMVLLLVVAWAFGTAAPALAYIGPGAGLSVIGTAVAFVGAVFFAILGFIWYPIKRLLGLLRRGRAQGEQPPVTP